MNFPIVIESQCLPQPKFCRAKYPNQSIHLYKGKASIIQGEDSVVEGKIVVLFEWFPYPHPKFEFTYFNQTRIESDEFILELTAISTKTKARVAQTTIYGSGSKCIISGYFSEPVIQGSDRNLASLTFNIPNFPWFNISNTLTWDWDDNEKRLEGWLQGLFDGQFVFQTNDWRIVLATIPDHYDFWDLLRAKGGYGLTHVCKLERTDRSSFSIEEAREQLEAFSYYLSFARGIWLAPILLSGYDFEGIQVFEEWSDCRADSWQNTYMWFQSDCCDVPETYSGFIDKWQDEFWRDLIKNSIRWYIESNKEAGGIEGAIILQQTALERLSWVMLVEYKGVLDAEGWNRLSAANRIRLLLSQLDICLEIPDRMTDLKQMSKEFNWKDGVGAVTAIRNALVHPNPKNYWKIDSSKEAARHQAWYLGLQYLEQVLLKLFNYPYSLDL